MNTPTFFSRSIAARLFAAAAAAGTTLVLVKSVVSIAEPQRGALLAKARQAQPVAAAPSAPVKMALNSVGQAGK